MVDSPDRHGERLAADYIVSQLQRIGARPVPGVSDFRVPFEFTSGNRDGGSGVGIKWMKDGTEAGVTAGVAPGNAGNSPAAVGALLLRTTARSRQAWSSRAARYRRARSQDFGYDSYTGLDVRTRSSWCCDIFPKTRNKRPKAFSPAIRTCATRRWRLGSTAPRRSSSSPARDRQTPENCPR
jgi:hypothetical protein